MNKNYCPGCRYVLPPREQVQQGICPGCKREYEFDAFGPVVRRPGRIYIANEIPGNVRIKHILSALFLLLSGGIGLLFGCVFVPVSGGHGIVVHGVLAWAAVVGMVAASAVLISVVLDHYDKRDNERSYRQFAVHAERVSWSLWLSVVLVYVVQHALYGDA